MSCNNSRPLDKTTNTTSVSLTKICNKSNSISVAIGQIRSPGPAKLKDEKTVGNIRGINKLLCRRTEKGDWGVAKIKEGNAWGINHDKRAKGIVPAGSVEKRKGGWGSQWSDQWLETGQQISSW